MTPRSLFNIILKIIGILFIRDMLTVIRELARVNIYLNRSTFDTALFIFLGAGVTLCAYVAVAYYLIFKSNDIIDRFRLDQGFQEKSFSFSMHRSSILSIAIIVIGGIMIAEEIPNLCSQFFDYIQNRRVFYRQRNGEIEYAVISIAKLIIGFILVFNQKQIVNVIELNRRRR